VPVIDGVIGGVKTVQDASSRVKPASLHSSAVTPGKLRYKENSGVCGMHFTAFSIKSLLDTVQKQLLV